MTRLTAPRTSRTAPELTRSKSTLRAAARAACPSSMNGRARAASFGRPRAPRGRLVAFGDAAAEPVSEPARAPAVAAPRDAPAQLLPEPAQPRHPFMRQVAGDDRGVDRADRRAGDPVRPHAGMFERGVCPGLVRAEAAAAGQNQRDPVETGQALFGSRARQTPLPWAAPAIATARRRRSIPCREPALHPRPARPIAGQPRVLLKPRASYGVVSNRPIPKC